MRGNFKRDYIYEYLDKFTFTNRTEALELVSIKVVEMKDEVIRLKEFGQNETFQMNYRFYEHLKALLYFLSTETKPDFIKQKVFNKFQWIAEKLVLIGELDESILYLFEN